MRSIVAVVITALALGGCSGGSDATDADVAFAQVIPHHEQAVEMAALVDRSDASPERAFEARSTNSRALATAAAWVGSFGSGM